MFADTVPVDRRAATAKGVPPYRRSRSLIPSHKSAYDFVGGVITSIEGVTTFSTFFRLRLRLCRLQSSENQITVLASRSELLLFGLVTLLLLATLLVSVVTRPVSQWYGHPRVLGIPIPKTLLKLKSWRTVSVIFFVVVSFFLFFLHYYTWKFRLNSRVRKKVLIAILFRSLTVFTDVKCVWFFKENNKNHLSYGK